jgi:hypothetical protein
MPAGHLGGSDTVNAAGLIRNVAGNAPIVSPSPRIDSGRSPATVTSLALSMVTAGWLTWLPRNTRGKARRNWKRESSPMMHTSRKPLCRWACGATFMPPP